MKFSKELKAGAIAIFAVAGFIYLYQFMKGKNVFSSERTYYSQLDNVQGLSVSSPVSINGLKVGQVDGITPVTGKNGKVSFVVALLVDKDYSFSKSSTVEVFEPGLMTGKELKIILGQGEPYAKSGDTLKGSEEASMLANLSSQIGPLKDQVQTSLKTIDSLTSNANKLLDAENRAEIKALLANLNQTVRAFETTSKQTNQLLANTDPRVQKVLDNADLATISAKNTLDKFGNVADQIDVKNLNQTIAKLGATTDNLNKIIGGIQNGDGSLGKLTKDDELYKNLNQTIESMNALVTDLKANPKRYVNISVFGKSEKVQEKK